MHRGGVVAEKNIFMNTVIATGYLPKVAWEAFTKGARKVLCFEVVLRDEGSAEESVWPCQIEDAAEMARVGNLLLPGRGVVLRARLGARPFVKNGMTKFIIYFLRVERVEFVKSDQSQMQIAPDEEGAEKK